MRTLKINEQREDFFCWSFLLILCTNIYSFITISFMIILHVEMFFKDGHSPRHSVDSPSLLTQLSKNIAVSHLKWALTVIF